MKASGRLHTAAAIGIIVGSLGLAGSARAGTLNSPVLSTGGTDTTVCSGVNVGSEEIKSITATILNTAGTALATSTCADVPANDDCFAAFTAPNTSRCQVTFTGSSKNIRGAISIGGAAGDKLALPATAK